MYFVSCPLNPKLQTAIGKMTKMVHECIGPENPLSKMIEELAGVDDLQVFEEAIKNIMALNPDISRKEIAKAVLAIQETNRLLAASGTLPSEDLEKEWERKLKLFEEGKLTLKKDVRPAYYIMMSYTLAGLVEMLSPLDDIQNFDDVVKMIMKDIRGVSRSDIAEAVLAVEREKAKQQCEQSKETQIKREALIEGLEQELFAQVVRVQAKTIRENPSFTPEEMEEAMKEGVLALLHAMPERLILLGSSINSEDTEDDEQT